MAPKLIQKFILEVVDIKNYHMNDNVTNDALKAVHISNRVECKEILMNKMYTTTFENISCVGVVCLKYWFRKNYCKHIFKNTYYFFQAN